MRGGKDGLKGRYEVQEGGCSKLKVFFMLKDEYFEERCSYTKKKKTG